MIDLYMSIRVKTTGEKANPSGQGRLFVFDQLILNFPKSRINGWALYEIDKFNRNANRSVYDLPYLISLLVSLLKSTFSSEYMLTTSRVNRSTRRVSPFGNVPGAVLAICIRLVSYIELSALNEYISLRRELKRMFFLKLSLQNRTTMRVDIYKSIGLDQQFPTRRETTLGVIARFQCGEGKIFCFSRSFSLTVISIRSFCLLHYNTLEFY